MKLDGRHHSGISVRDVALRKLAFTWDHSPKAEKSGELCPRQDGDQSLLRLIPHEDQNKIRLDHTTLAALRRGILSRDQINSISCSHERSSVGVTWRQIALAFPGKDEQLRALAADVYGFRSIKVCQIGTLIYNEKLCERLSSHDWKALFDRSIVPVIEYGKVPKIVERHLLASSDPGSRFVRDVTDEIRMTQTELVFVPERTISKIQNLLTTNIPVLGIDPSISRRLDSQNQNDNSRLASGKRAA